MVFKIRQFDGNLAVDKTQENDLGRVRVRVRVRVRLGVKGRRRLGEGLDRVKVRVKQRNISRGAVVRPTSMDVWQ